jgi:DNA-binding protein HU-beta
MNQSELIEKVAQTTELNQAAAGQAVKAVVNAILDALLAGEAVRVSGLGIFNVALRPAREGRNPRTGESTEIAASKAVRFHAGKAVKDASIHRLRRRPPGRGLHHQRNPRCGSKRPLAVRWVGTAASALAVLRGASERPKTRLLCERDREFESLPRPASLLRT